MRQLLFPDFYLLRTKQNRINNYMNKFIKEAQEKHAQSSHQYAIYHVTMDKSLISQLGLAIALLL
jgi:hypothetical protein